MRDTVSAPPPAEYGITTRTGFAGQVCAAAEAQARHAMRK
jgi:hypothetical protein